MILKYFANKTYSLTKKSAKISYLNFLLLILLFFSVNLRAQSDKEIATHNNGWFMYFGNHRVSEKLGIHTEYQWRRNDWINNWQQSLLRVGLDWHVEKSLTVTTGYGWIKSFPYGEQPISFSFNEHRIWQQLILQHNSKSFYFHHRYRLEQRFLENITLDANETPFSSGFNYLNRARYRFLVTVPINKKELEENTLFTSIYNEVFLGFGKGIKKNILDQNRLYFALGWFFNKNCNVQFGYLNHYVIKTDGISHERNHTLQVGLQYNLSFL